ncbi:2,3-dihydro-2,3-dihydroxybenzoate dehydrogenase [Nocardia sp. BMG51109]|uniref:2,3-dihydro-2,3-dihydroxybenzoate dehydrogenase n=1 Tax=Nocardia sp. BMG51109 TaxID=1056816 RepID=UPI0004B7C776|nr:2,3-dihydro-2,3-dihydroxybenzoate dehydrogenase [Nocardia sp. BMG51109]
MIESGKSVVVVTGAAGGIGAAIAAGLAEDAKVLSLWDRDPRIHGVARDIGESAPGTECAAEVVDVTDPARIGAAFDRIAADHGPVDVLVHAAGVMEPGSALDISPDAWERCLAVNTTGAMHVTQRAARDMAAVGRGSIVVVSSNAANTPRIAMAAYGAAKAATTAFTRSLALEVAPRGVRVNLVSPGSTDTAMLRGLYADGDEPLDAPARTSLLDGDPGAYRLGIPLRRIASPADIAAAVRFLVSDGARHITMHDLRVDGGATLDM